MIQKYGKKWIEDFEKMTQLHLSIPFVTDK